MGFFDKLAGRPQEPRRHHSSKAEERLAERAATRGSRESSTLSFSGSQIGGPTHPGLMQPSRSRQSSRTRRGSSQSHSPLASPRSHEGSQGLEDKWRHVVSLATGHHQRQSPRQTQPHHDQPKPSYEPQPRPQQSSEQVRELQHKVHMMEAQIQEVEGIKQRLVAEQRFAQEWREKWNFQNFKLNLMVDMMVLQALEGDAGGASGSRGPAGSLTTASFAHA